MGTALPEICPCKNWNIGSPALAKRDLDSYLLHVPERLAGRGPRASARAGPAFGRLDIVNT